MTVTLEALKFNHDPGGKTTGAFNIRRNEGTHISIPEWEKEKNERPEDSPAAYALDKVELLKFKTTIKARFSSSNTKPTRVRVKARLEEFVERLAGETSLANVPVTPIILGETDVRDIVLTSGQLGYETFTFTNPRFWQRGVGVREITWRWQYSPPSSNKWTDFALTHHRIYTVISRPTDPWKPDSSTASDTQVPWTDVLDYACRWAANTTTVDDAAAEITRALTRLGHDGLLHYDDPNSGAANFTYKEPFMFDCTDFLRLLTGQKNKQGRRVNCDDCAAIVVTFANIVGCDLKERETGPPFFPKLHLRIGLPGVFGNKFHHHTVAWKGAATENDQLFDGCLQLNSARPTAMPRWFVPVNIQFGRADEDKYRFFLASDPYDCEPIGRVGRRTLGRPKIMKSSLAGFLKLSNANPFAARVFSKRSLLTWRLTDYRFVDTEAALYFLQTFWIHKSGKDTSLVIDAYECDSPRHARRLLKIILSTFQLTDIRKIHTDFGDVGFANPTRYAIVFVRGSFVFRLRNTGVRPVPADGFARFVDKLANKVLLK